MNTLSRFVTVAAMGTFAAACGDSSGAGGAGGSATSTATGAPTTTAGGNTATTSTGASGLTADEACTARSTAACNQLDTCSNGAQVATRYGDKATCIARQKLACMNSLGAAGTGLTPMDVGACAAAIPGESCADLENNNPPAACLPVAGAEASASACGFASQCATQYCLVDKAKVCGVCGPEPVVGGPCLGVGDCDKNQVCPAALGQCEAPVALNGACGKTAPCGSGLSCQGATMMLNDGQCKQAGATVGAACDAKQKTAPGCDREKGLYCTAGGVCAVIAHAAANQPCGLVNGAEVNCAGGGQCIIPASATEGTCIAPAADGAACDSSVGPPCMAPAKCVVTGGGNAGTCKVPTGMCP